MVNRVYENGYTSALCQLSFMELLEDLFEGRTFKGQNGEKALSIYRQDLPIPTGIGDDEQDIEGAPAPFVIVHVNGGSVVKSGSPSGSRAPGNPFLQNIVSMSLIICVYDAADDREGWRDAENIKEAILQKVCSEPYFGGAFTVRRDTITWAYQGDDSSPYYFCGMDFDCTAPLATQHEALKGLV